MLNFHQLPNTTLDLCNNPIDSMIMAVTLNREDKEALELLSDDIKKLSFNLISFSMTLVLKVFELIRQYVQSLSDFKTSNVKSVGLMTILSNRAHAFFSVKEEQVDQAVNKDSKITMKRVIKIVKKLCKTLIFPLVVLVIIASWLVKTEKKKKNNVTNRYNV